MLDGCDELYVIRSNSHQPSSILVSTGTRLLAHVTAMGRVLLVSLALELPPTIVFVVHNVIPPNYSAVCFRSLAT